jgi:hypothetical protein
VHLLQTLGHQLLNQTQIQHKNSNRNTTWRDGVDGTIT